VHAHFRPEFVNRVDEFVVFQPLQLGQIKQIVRLQVRMPRRFANDPRPLYPGPHALYMHWTNIHYIHDTTANDGCITVGLLRSVCYRRSAQEYMPGLMDCAGMQVKRVEERLADRTMHLVLQASPGVRLGSRVCLGLRQI